MTKGEETRSEILSIALDEASQLGLEGLSIGTLASRIGMSKSGLFAHFGSKEALQEAVLDTARDRFVAFVVAPALRAPRGEPRVRALLANWLDWLTDVLPGGCVFASSAWEFDDRPGPLRDRVAADLADLHATIARSVRLAVEQGHFGGHVEPEQFAFEAYGVLMSFHLQRRLLRAPDARARAERAVESLIASAHPHRS